MANSTFYKPGVKTIKHQLAEEIVALEEAEKDLDAYLFDFHPAELRLKLERALRRITELEGVLDDGDRKPAA